MQRQPSFGAAKSSSSASQAQAKQVTKRPTSLSDNFTTQMNKSLEKSQNAPVDDFTPKSVLKQPTKKETGKSLKDVEFQLDNLSKMESPKSPKSHSKRSSARRGEINSDLKNIIV